MAVGLSHALERFYIKAGTTDEFSERAAFFDDLVASIDQLQLTHGSVLIDALRQGGQGGQGEAKSPSSVKN